LQVVSPRPDHRFDQLSGSPAVRRVRSVGQVQNISKLAGAMKTISMIQMKSHSRWLLLLALWALPASFFAQWQTKVGAQSPDCLAGADGDDKLASGCQARQVMAFIHSSGGRTKIGSGSHGPSRTPEPLPAVHSLLTIRPRQLQIDPHVAIQIRLRSVKIEIPDGEPA